LAGVRRAERAEDEKLSPAAGTPAGREVSTAAPAENYDWIQGFDERQRDIFKRLKETPLWAKRISIAETGLVYNTGEKQQGVETRDQYNR
jgi:hypothetical protein